MRLSGITFVKDAIKFDFPIKEVISSMLPICDEVYANIGVSEDDTLELVNSIDDPKLKVFETEWDPDFKAKGRILAVQTNIPLYKCRGDWVLYLQGDEVLHEDDYDAILATLDKYKDDHRVEGFLFDYYHFFGDHNHYARSYHWYKQEIRIIRNHLGIQSWRSAQSFRVDGRKLRVKRMPATIYHYGWVRDPHKMAVKKKYHDSLHHGDSDEKAPEKLEFSEFIDPYMLAEYKGSHPAAVKERVENWKYPFDPAKNPRKLSLKDMKYRVLDFIDYRTGIRIGEYRNFKLIK
ncbi:MAG: glycosyltransferase family 2 protein [Elusimicrobia bacterium]|nr:glycosyltransferase family 2 protein [Elusimicrobiota bacterium]